MKTSREMTDSVLHRAAQAAARQKQTRTRAVGILTGALCAVLIVGLTLVPWGSEQPSITTQEQLPKLPTVSDQGDVSISTGKVYFLSNPGQADMLTQLNADATYALDHVIRVFPREAKEEALAFHHAWSLKYDAIASEGSKETYVSHGTTIYSLSAGFTSLILPDHTQIARVDIESTGVLTLHRTNAEIHTEHTINVGEYSVTLPAGSYREYLNFSPSQETVELLAENPETPLSTIRDTFTVTIHYTNSTSEVLKIDVYLDDEGQVYTSLCKNSTF